MIELEKSRRLTDSLLWSLQHIAYSQFGPDAWANKGVPFYLTSNPLIAKQFAGVILAYIRDCIRKGGENAIDFSQPFYIFDLGAGSGRLGYLILKHLLPMVHETISPELKICYVMADMVESNIEFLKTRPLLENYISSGNLDFAIYHHSHKPPLKLMVSGEVLEENNIVNPIALVCTYYFDTVPQDLFKAKNGALEEGRISILLPANEESIDANSLQPEMIKNLEAKFDYAPIENPSTYYPERPEFNALLQYYMDLFEDTPFLYPIGGLESLRFFSLLSNNRLLLLAGDQGVSTEKQVREWGEPKIFRHASFSMAVSYHLLSRYFQNQGGVGLLTSFPNPKYVVMSGVLGGSVEDFPDTCLAFRKEIDFFEPVEYWELTNLKPEQLDLIPLEHILLYVKMGNWDPINFHLFFSDILKKLPDASMREKENLQQTIHKVWENFYPVNPQEGDFVMNLGVLFFEMKNFEEALFFFLKSKEVSGGNSNLYMNLAKCYSIMGDEVNAKKYFLEAVSMKANGTIKEIS